jgi:restriction system protein
MRSVIRAELKLDLDQLVRLLVDNYDNADMDMRAILPLVRIYWPA